MEQICHKMQPSDVEAVIFHYPCQDGLASAWVAHYFLENQPIFIPVQNIQNNEKLFQNVCDKIAGKNVIILDFSFDLDQTMRLKSHAKNLIILDHHVTNKERLESLDFAYFDMNRSGAGLAWDYFSPKCGGSPIDINYNNYNNSADISFFKRDKRPTFIDFIQDRDLWTWHLPQSKDFCEGFHYYTSLEDDFQNCFRYFDELMTNTDLINRYIDLGRTLRLKKEKTMKNIVEHNQKRYTYRFGETDYRVALCNSTGDFKSDLGNMFAVLPDCDFAAIWSYDHNNEEYWCSLRSVGDIDVSKIASHFGGGGHPNAAGCAFKQHPIAVFS